MSADNYYYVFKRGDKFVVQCRFASSEYTENDKRAGGQEFDTLAEASNYAFGEYSEYGVEFDFPTEVIERDSDNVSPT